MVRNYRFDWDANTAKNFFIVEADLKKIAAEKEVELREVIQGFISDLENRGNEDYEVKVGEIKINGAVSQKFIADAKKYFGRVIEGLERAQKKEAKKEKINAGKQEIESIWESVIEYIEANKDLTLTEVLLQIKEKTIFSELNSSQRKAMIKRTEQLIQDEEKKESLRKSKIERSWKDICAIVNRECPQGDLTEREHLKNTIAYWNAIKDKISLPQEGRKSQFGISDSMQDDILGLINEQINTSEELLYYKEVEYVTKGFSFLARYPEFEYAVKGRSGRKFIDRKSYDRFYDLRASVQNGRSEYSQISRMLREGKIDETSRKILTERKKFMEVERAKKEADSLESYGGR